MQNMGTPAPPPLPLRTCNTHLVFEAVGGILTQGSTDDCPEEVYYVHRLTVHEAACEGRILRG